MSKGVLWLVRDSKGQIKGPLDEDTVVRMIYVSRLKEDDSIAKHPDGQWVRLSTNPTFYDAVMAVLSGQVRLDDVRGVSGTSSDFENIIALESPAEPIKSRAVREPAQSNRSENQMTEVSKIPADSLNGPNDFSQKTSDLVGDDVINLSAESDLVEKHRRKQLWGVLLFLIGAFGLAYVYFENPDADLPKGSIHLLAPRESQPPLNEDDLQENLKRASLQFQKDTFKGYFKAQSFLVEAVEGAPKNTEALALLCLTYRELWAYSFQDSVDLAALSQVSQLAAKVDSFGIKGALCRITQLVLSGQSEAAQNSIKTVLNQSPDTPFFYEMRAQMLSDVREYQTAIAFVQKAQQLFPDWVKPYFLQAKYHFYLGQMAESKKMYQKVLEMNKDHALSQVELGRLEFSYFHRDREGIQWISNGLKTDRIPSAARSKGLETLAVYARRQGENGRAIQYAEEAFQVDPTNLSVRELLLQWGAKPEENRIGCQERIRLGDQYMKTSNWLSAQMEYRSAFDACQPKNALVAMKAAQALWNMNQSLDAIHWMEKAVQTDPSLIIASVQLAQYYAQRYEFEKAYQTLKLSQQKGSQSPDLWRGFAFVELKRNNFLEAIRYGEQALRMYDNDLETHLLLIEAYKGSRQFEKGFQVAARAIELDKNSARAQGMYAEALAGFQGIETAVKYLKNLIDTYPSEVEYRISQAKILRLDDRNKEAVETLVGALKIDPNHKEARLLLGGAYLGAGSVREALDSFLTVVTLDPTDPIPLMAIGDLYLGKSDFQNALLYYEKAEDLNPRYPRVHYLMGRSAFGLKNYQRTMSEADQEKRINPQLSDAFVLAGECYLAQGRESVATDQARTFYKKASEEFQKALRLRVQKAPVYILLARSHRLSKNYDIAQTMLNMAASIESGNPEIFKEKGALYQERGENGRAIAAYQTYLELAVGAPDRDKINQVIQELRK